MSIYYKKIMHNDLYVYSELKQHLNESETIVFVKNVWLIEFKKKRKRSKVVFAFLN